MVNSLFFRERLQTQCCQNRNLVNSPKRCGMIQKNANSGFEAVQKHINLVDLIRPLQILEDHASIDELGVDTAVR